MSEEPSDPVRVRRKSVRIDSVVRNCFCQIEILKLQLECLHFAFMQYDRRYSYRKDDARAESKFQELEGDILRSLNQAYRDLLLMSGLSSDEELVRLGQEAAYEFFIEKKEDFSRILNRWGYHDPQTFGENEELKTEIAEALEWAQAQGPVIQLLRRLAREEKRKGR